MSSNQKTASKSNHSIFSKSLFKQSCKANGTMWIIITVAVCFMLCCVMLIAGKGDLGKTKENIVQAIITDTLESQTQGRAVNYYETVNGGLEVFDTTFVTSLQTAALGGKDVTSPEVQGQAYTAAMTAYKTYTDTVCQQMIVQLEKEQKTELGRDLTEEEKAQIAKDVQREIPALMFATFNSFNTFEGWSAQQQQEANAVFTAKEPAGAVAPHYDTVIETTLAATLNPSLDEAGRAEAQKAQKAAREEYVFTNTTIFLAYNMVDEENIKTVLEVLSDYGVTREDYHEVYGYDDYAKVKGVARDVLVNYRASLAYEIEANKIDASTVEGKAQIAKIKADLTKELAGGLLTNLDEEVSNALEEIGSADLYGTLVGSIFFKMAGLLLPIIYMIMTANALIAGQVDSGSMAYILSSGTKRNEVVFTQALFLIGSLFAMFVCTTITSIVCFAIVNVNTGLTYGKLVLINLGAFLVMFAMSGICFLASCVFNRSKRSMALGGGLNMFFLVATMLGLFGSAVLPSIIRMSALNAFNYVSIISLFDVISILHGTLTFLWKWSILIVVGIICYVVGSLRFKKKDLPL